MKRLLLIFVFLLPTFILQGLDCDDMPERNASFKARGNKLYMNGTIAGNTPKRLKKALRRNRRIKTVVMQCVPGSKNDKANLKAARMVRARGINTHIADGGMVASGGTDFFLSGVERTIGDDVYIGVHAWGTDEDEPTADKFPKNHPDHKKYLKYYRAMGIPAAFYWFTLRAAPADGMHNMTDAELEKYKIITD